MLCFDGKKIRQISTDAKSEEIGKYLTSEIFSNLLIFSIKSLRFDGFFSRQVIGGNKYCKIRLHKLHSNFQLTIG